MSEKAKKAGSTKDLQVAVVIKDKYIPRSTRLGASYNSLEQESDRPKEVAHRQRPREPCIV